MEKIKTGMKYVALVLFAVILIGCAGDSGETSLKYWWVGSLQYIYDNNPSTPQTIYNDLYFQTDPGDFYMEYVAFDGSGWYMYYNIEANDGKPFFVDGDPLWYEIGLYSFGPSLYRYTSALSNFDVTSQGPESKTVETVPEPISTHGSRTEILGTQFREFPWGTITIEYGRIDR